MTRRLWLVTALWLAGCATTGDVAERVPPREAARVPASVPALASARAAAGEAARALAAAREEQGRAVEAARAARIASADTRELADVAAAQRRHLAATVEWRGGVVEAARWRLAAAEAQVELERARRQSPRRAAAARHGRRLPSLITRL